MAKNKKGKAGVPQKKKDKPVFIKFSKIHQAFLQEIVKRHQDELNVALDLIYDEIPEIDITKPKDEVQYLVRQDASGVDVRYPREEREKKSREQLEMEELELLKKLEEERKQKEDLENGKAG